MTKKIKKVLKATGISALWAIPLAAFGADDPFGIEKVDTDLGGTLGNRPLTETVASIINVALSLLGIVAVVIILAGGFMWMTAAGNEEKLEKAKQLIFGGIIGLAIILSAYAIARFVIDNLVTATTTG